MKKKVFFILSSLRAGGAERVFWLLSQNLNKAKFDVSLVLLTADDPFFSTDLDGVKLVNLNTARASKSFFKLYSLIRREKPDAIFSTGGQINLLLGCISLFLKSPVLIARPTNQDNSGFINLKAKVLSRLGSYVYQKFDKIICQSDEIREFIQKKHRIADHKIIVIPNPVIIGKSIPRGRIDTDIKRLIVVARLTAQKGISRLLDILDLLPPNYHLTIVGDGPLRDEIATKISSLNLTPRVKMMGQIKNVLEVVAEHHLFVLPSYIEGFPNVVAESLSVGTPVISFKVGGITELIIDGFNGFVLNQNDLELFRSKIVFSCEKKWDWEGIRKDIGDRFGLEMIAQRYEQLI